MILKRKLAVALALGWLAVVVLGASLAEAGATQHIRNEPAPITEPDTLRTR